MRVEITAETGAGSTPSPPSCTMWTSSRPTSIGAAPWMRASRSFELSQATAASVLAKRCRITQSTCAGGLGGITVCLMKPGNAATTALVSSCQRAKPSALSGRTRVWVTIVTVPLAALAASDPAPDMRCSPLTAAPRASRRCGPA